jgi:hypothetical protein
MKYSHKTHVNSANIQPGNMAAGLELVVTLLRMLKERSISDTIIEQADFDRLKVGLWCK